jgi:hypothetical protein
MTCDFEKDIVSELLSKKTFLLYLRFREETLSGEYDQVIKTYPPKKREPALAVLRGRLREIRALRGLIQGGNCQVKRASISLYRSLSHKWGSE